MPSFMIPFNRSTFKNFVKGDITGFESVDPPQSAVKDK